MQTSKRPQGKQFNYTQDRSFFPCCSEVPLYTTPRISLLHRSYYINLLITTNCLYTVVNTRLTDKEQGHQCHCPFWELCVSLLSPYIPGQVYTKLTQQLNNTKLHCRHTVSHTTNQVIQKGCHCLLIVCGVHY